MLPDNIQGLLYFLYACGAIIFLYIISFIIFLCYRNIAYPDGYVRELNGQLFIVPAESIRVNNQTALLENN